jgi:N-acetylmuramoyl-L-alanine amidase
MAVPIRLHDSGQRVRDHQTHVNDRLREHGNPTITVDGDCGPQTILQSAFVAWFLGALDGTIKTIQGGMIAEGVLTITADPDSRDAGQRQRANSRRDKPFLETIILAGEWGAAKATHAISRVGRPDKIIFHHTDGHHPDLDQNSGESNAEAIAFAQAIQRDHMHRQPPLIDSGHNFLVTRSGVVLEGRHGSVAAIMDGVMVESAHCPSQNDQPGIEHEHKGNEAMTPAQRNSSLFVHEFICRHTGIPPNAVHGHREFFATDCPGALDSALGQFRRDLATRLAQ